MRKLWSEHRNIRVRTGVRITGLDRDDNGLTGVQIQETGSGKTELVPCDGLFEAIGLIPENQAFADLVPLNAQGYFDVGEQCETVTPGIYVAGDCRNKSVRQLTTAVADGAVAALAACRYLNK